MEVIYPEKPPQIHLCDYFLDHYCFLKPWKADVTQSLTDCWLNLWFVHRSVRTRHFFSGRKCKEACWHWGRGQAPHLVSALTAGIQNMEEGALHNPLCCINPIEKLVSQEGQIPANPQHRERGNTNKLHYKLRANRKQEAQLYYQILWQLLKGPLLIN